MPSKPHEVLIVMLREQPGLLAKLVAKLTAKHLPKGLKPADATLRFVDAAELGLDIVFRAGRRDWTIVEVQRGIDLKKCRKWLLATAVLFNQTGKLGDLVVIAPRKAVASWARTVVQVRSARGTRVRLDPVVLDLSKDDGKELLDPRHPELAFFAAWAMQHRHGPKARRVVERAIELTERLPRALRGAQQRAIMSVLSERMLALLREASMNPDKIPESPAAKRTRLFLEAQGHKKGRAEGRQAMLLKLLQARDIPVSPEDTAFIRACSDVAKLDRWFDRALTASSIREVLGAPARRKPAAESRTTNVPHT